MTLRNLDPEDSRAYLQAHGIAPALHERLLESSHGHPLGLSLLTDLVGRGGEAVVDPLTPDLVGVLLQRFVEVGVEEFSLRGDGLDLMLREDVIDLFKHHLHARKQRVVAALFFAGLNGPLQVVKAREEIAHDG